MSAGFDDTLIQESKAPLTLTQEIRKFLLLAFPMVCSLATEPIMNFFDALFLAHYQEGQGELYISASISGAMVVYAILALCIAVVEYTNPLVAQHIGAGNAKQCGAITMQALWFSMGVYPILLVFSWIGLPVVFTWFEHDALQVELELQYSQMLIYGAIVQLARYSIAGFFIGIERTRIVFVSSVIAMMVNIPLNYVLIFGKLGFPPMGIAGAAIATVASNIVALLILLIVYLHTSLHSKYNTRTITFNTPYIKSLIRFGLPLGIEECIQSFVLGYFVLAMGKYGTQVLAAMGIAFYWEGLVNITMWGVSYAAISLVGSYMGQKNVKATMRIFYIVLITLLIYVIITTIVFLLAAEYMAGVFTHNMGGNDIDGMQIHQLTINMLRLMTCYFIFDGITIAFYSVLQGAGDTKGVAILFLLVDILFALAITIWIIPQSIAPLTSWLIFIAIIILFAIGSGIRFFQGKWKNIQVV